ncbi:MAG: 3-dehydroquinate synthase [Dehalococcoidia bacterium]|nr:MAG: 3-dehydroquinate synthase [Dehalococcoidia bacterium]
MEAERRATNLIITGFSGTGKSAVAREVARRLNRDCIDTDDEVVKDAGKPIAEIFRQDGEGKFRELEREAVRRACRQRQNVITIGGGAIVDRQNYHLLTRSGLIVCLEARPETICERLFHEAARSPEAEVRPLLATDDPLERIRQLKASRQPYYAEVDWTVHTDRLTIGQVAEEVIRAWGLLRRADGCQLSAFNDQDIACLVETETQNCPVFVGYGLLDRLGDKVRRAGLSGATIIVSDDNVFSLYGERVERILKNAGFAVHSFVVPPGEETKSIDYASRMYDFLVGHRAERDDVIIALGGGMVGDLAGFVAATFLRGIFWVQVPTSLVAMVDASIGGKVGVNHPQGKNLIGAFYQPNLVLADYQTLATLPQRELISGWAEVIKHGLILDEEFFRFLEDNVKGLRELETEALTRAIARSAAIKAGVVSQDEKERAGRRTILNYGHTIGHGLEAATQYKRFLHGEAVAIGMMGAAKLSQGLDLLPSTAVNRQQALLQEFSLPTSLPAKRGNSKLSLAEVTGAMELDKKMKEEAIHWVLLQDIGKAVIRTDVPQKNVLAVLQELAGP